MLLPIDQTTNTVVPHDVSGHSWKLYLAMRFVLTSVNMVVGDKIGVSVVMNFRE